MRSCVVLIYQKEVSITFYFIHTKNFKATINIPIFIKATRLQRVTRRNGTSTGLLTCYFLSNYEQKIFLKNHRFFQLLLLVHPL